MELNDGGKLDQIRQKLDKKGFEIDYRGYSAQLGMDRGFFSVYGTPLVEQIKNHPHICVSLKGAYPKGFNRGIDIWAEQSHDCPIVMISHNCSSFDIDGVVELITSHLAPYPSIKGAIH